MAASSGLLSQALHGSSLAQARHSMELLRMHMGFLVTEREQEAAAYTLKGQEIHELQCRNMSYQSEQTMMEERYYGAENCAVKYAWMLKQLGRKVSKNYRCEIVVSGSCKKV